MNLISKPFLEKLPVSTIDWKPKPYEYVLLTAIFIYLFLQSGTNLPYSAKLARIFLTYAIMLILIVYVSASLFVCARIFFNAISNGWRTCLDKNLILEMAYPYYSLNFLVLNIRRGLSIVGIVYFFLHLKHIILYINSRNFDLFYWDLDRFLHFGVQPNIFLLETLGSINDIAILTDWLYFKFFFFQIVTVVFFMLELDTRALSEKFFTAFALVWALGGLTYIIAPADGPCYSILINHSTRQEDRIHLFHYPVTEDVPKSYIQAYNDAKIWTAKSYQEALWHDRADFFYRNTLPGIFYGIAAMPSLHVAVMVLMTFFLFMVSRFLGSIALILTITTFLGSILLQWHYAVDGYAGIIFGLFVCFLSRKICKEPNTN